MASLHQQFVWRVQRPLWHIYCLLVEICSDLKPYQALLNRIIAKIPDYRSVNVLQLGCGTGRFAMKLRRERNFASYIGVDRYRTLSYFTRRKLRKEYRDYLFIHCANYQSIDVATASQDIIICMESPKPFAAELCRVLRPNGYVLAAIPMTDYSLGPILSEHFSEAVFYPTRCFGKLLRALPVYFVHCLDRWLGITDYRSAHFLSRNEICKIYGVFDGESLNARQSTLVPIPRSHLEATIKCADPPPLATLAA